MGEATLTPTRTPSLITLLAPQSRHGVKTRGVRLEHFQELEMGYVKTLGVRIGFF